MICNKKITIESLGIIVNQVVTILGTWSYTSGAQLWKGAAAILNKNPTNMKVRPNKYPLLKSNKALV
jgi:hypothetical protein